MSVDYETAQWFDAPPPCRVCGKPAGSLMSFDGNGVLAYMCRKHADKAIADAHRKHKRFEPDVFVRPRTDTATSTGEG